MNIHLKKQEVAQGVKLGSFKEFQTLNSNELKKIEGGALPIALLILRGLAIVASAAVAYHDATCCRCNTNNCK